METKEHQHHHEEQQQHNNNKIIKISISIVENLDEVEALGRVHPVRSLENPQILFLGQSSKDSFFRLF